MITQMDSCLSELKKVVTNVVPLREEAWENFALLFSFQKLAGFTVNRLLN
jgi:hypothetical protein